MKNILLMGVFLIVAFVMVQCVAPQTKDDMITHTVYFKLKHDKGSEEEQLFIRKALDLGGISTVHNLRCVKEVSPKNNFDYGLIMQFDDQAAYDTYNNHPDHQAFVENVWKKEVLEFMEVDYVANGF